MTVREYVQALKELLGSEGNIRVLRLFGHDRLSRIAVGKPVIKTSKDMDNYVYIPPTVEEARYELHIKDLIEELEVINPDLKVGYIDLRAWRGKDALSEFPAPTLEQAYGGIIVNCKQS